MVQPLISVVAKRMQMSSNLAKRKRDEEDRKNHVRKKSIPTPVILFTMISTAKERWPLSSSLVNHGLFTGSSFFPSAKLSDLENISLSVETFAIDEGQESIRAF